MSPVARLMPLVAVLMLALTYLAVRAAMPDTGRPPRLCDALRVLARTEAALHRAPPRARAGLLRSTIYHGLSDSRHKVSAPSGRIRKEGGGRKKKAIEDPTLVIDLKSFVEPLTRGDPMQPLLWTSRSLRNLVKELANNGHKVCPTVVGDLLRSMGYSLQAN